MTNRNRGTLDKLGGTFMMMTFRHLLLSGLLVLTAIYGPRLIRSGDED